MSEGKMEIDIDKRIGVASAVMQTLKRSVLMKRALSQKDQLSIYRSTYILTLTYGHWLLRE